MAWKHSETDAGQNLCTIGNVSQLEVELKAWSSASITNGVKRWVHFRDDNIMINLVTSIKYPPNQTLMLVHHIQPQCNPGISCILSTYPNC